MIEDMKVLTTFDGLGNINTSHSLPTFHIVGNPKLTSINALNKLSNFLSYEVQFLHNPALACAPKNFPAKDKSKNTIRNGIK